MLPAELQPHRIKTLRPLRDPVERMAREGKVAYQQQRAVDMGQLQPRIRAAEGPPEDLTQPQPLDERLHQRQRSNLLRVQPQSIFLAFHNPPPASSTCRSLTKMQSYCISTAGPRQGFPS